MLEPHPKYDKTTIAISHPRNLKIALTKTALSLPEGQTVQNYINAVRKLLSEKSD
jgi:hypothetical protein